MNPIEHLKSSLIKEFTRGFKILFLEVPYAHATFHTTLTKRLHHYHSGRSKSNYVIDAPSH